MECPSIETRSALTAPEFTRLRASQPWVLLAEICSRADVVLVHVSGGRELALKPSLNIIGIEHPRGLREVISGDMLIAVDIAGAVV